MRREKDGFVLVAIIWIIAILTVLTLGLANRALVDQRAAALSLDKSKAQYRARGAVQYAVADIQNKAMIEQLMISARERAAASGVHASINMTGSGFQRGGVHTVTLSSADGVFSAAGTENANSVRYTVSDEESRISLNTAPEVLLDEIDGLSFRAVSAIMQHRGGELNPEEQNLFLTVEEARFLEGIDEYDWQGSDDEPGLRELFTVHGAGRINLNSASREVLLAIPDVDEGVVESVINYRVGGDRELNTADDRSFRSMESVSAVTGVEPTALAPIQQYCTLESQFFTITGFASERQGKVRAASQAIVHIQPGSAALLSWSEGELGP